jgi:hypothetical protein
MGYSEWGLLILLYNLLVDKIWGLVMTEWISVKDQLPQPLEQVLIYSIRGIEIAYILKNLDVFMISDTIRSDKNFVNVTHWCELPAPPVDP